MNTQCKMAICDDSPDDIGYIKRLVTDWAETRNAALKINTFPSAEAFLFDYAENKNYNILLLDIEMGGMDGVELAKTVRESNSAVQIVFITGFADFIAEGYEVAALHYLMKPVSADKLTAVLDRAAALLGKSEKSVIFNIDGESVRTNIGDIVSVEAFAHSCAVTTVNEKFEVKSSITEVEKLLNAGFIRCHRSYIVGIKYIKSISKTSVTLDTGVQIPLSRANYNAVNQAFIRYYN